MTSKREGHIDRRTDDAQARERCQRLPVAALLLASLQVFAVGGALAARGAEDSVFALVTQRGGFAKSQGHVHLIAAGARASVAVQFDGERLLETSFALETTAADLEVDEDVLRERWQQRLLELGVLEEPFGALDGDQRSKIRDSMLGRKQLDAQRFPEITARLLEVREQAIEIEDSSYPLTIEVELTAHGQTATGRGGARILDEEGGQRLEALVPLRFTDLGIEPFSAFLGAVKNLDAFFLYANVPAESR